MVISRQSERLFDLRTIRRSIRAGNVTKEKYDEYLRSLPDMAENIAPLSSMDDDGEGKSGRGEGAAPSAPSFPRRTDAPILTGDDDDDDIDDEDDDDDDDEEDEDDEAPVAARGVSAPVIATPEDPAVSGAPGSDAQFPQPPSDDLRAAEAGDDPKAE